MTDGELPPEWRQSFEYLIGFVKLALKLALIFSGRKIVSTIILRLDENFL
jgi:hypothetical protein